MKAKLFFLVSCVFGLAANGQNVSSTSSLTSGGQDAGTSGTGGTYYGYEAGKNTTTASHSRGQRNTFIGSQAGKSNVLGRDNCYMGSASGLFSTGAYNSFLGSSSGASLTSGDENTFVGSNSGIGVTTGSANTFLGSASGDSSSGSENLYLGYFAGSGASGSRNIFIGYGAGFGLNTSNKLVVSGDDYANPIIYGDFTTNKVGIGNVTTFPSTVGGVNVSAYKLFVEGGILTKEVRVATTWADYVFEESYTLPTLEEVESHIKEKGHLMNVPSAQTVETQGISLGEMAKIQQEKIEELTLYILEQHKINKKQSEELQFLKQRMDELSEKLNK